MPAGDGLVAGVTRHHKPRIWYQDACWGLTTLVHWETHAAYERFLNHREQNFMTWKEDNATTFNPLLPIGKEMSGELGSRREFQYRWWPETVRVQPKNKQFPQCQTQETWREQWREGTERSYKTRRKVGQGSPLGNALKRGINFRSDWAASGLLCWNEVASQGIHPFLHPDEVSEFPGSLD